MIAAKFIVSAAVSTSNLRLSQRKMSSKGAVLLFWRFLRSFIKVKQPRCQYDCPARCIWLTHFTPTQQARVNHLGAVPALGIVTHGPRFQMSCHISSWLQSTLRAGNPNRWLNAFEKTPPDSLGAAQSLVGDDGLEHMLSKKCQREEMFVYPPGPQNARPNAGYRLLEMEGHLLLQNIY